MNRKVLFLAHYCMWIVVETDEDNARERWTKGGWYSERDAEDRMLCDDHDWEDWTPITTKGT